MSNILISIFFSIIYAHKNLSGITVRLVSSEVYLTSFLSQYIARTISKWKHLYQRQISSVWFLSSLLTGYHLRLSNLGMLHFSSAFQFSLSRAWSKTTTSFSATSCFMPRSINRRSSDKSSGRAVRRTVPGSLPKTKVPRSRRGNFRDANRAAATP